MAKDFRDFISFYENDFIKSIAGNDKWTISDNKKVPIDMKALIYDKKIYGANMYSEINPCVTLNELLNTVPNATNHAYYLDCAIDKFVVLDVEPKCPDEIKKELLKLPYLYGEISMSGKGYHMVFTLPDSFYDYPAATQKLALKEEHGYYEILLNHFVTFTRNMLPSATGENDFVPIFNKLASEAKDTKRTDFELDAERPKNIPLYDDLIAILLKQNYNKTADDFNNDMSKYEYAHIGFLYYKLTMLLNVSYVMETGHNYTDTEKAWIVYEAASQVIPKRAKHDEQRAGMPWLLYLTQEVIAKQIHQP